MPLDSAQRLLTHVRANGHTDFNSKNPLSRIVQDKIRNLTRFDQLQILDRIMDPNDGSIRYLFQSTDGAVFEAVRIPLGKPNQYSICLSSQAGCAMMCDFCATGRMGLKRHLEVWEIIAQFWQIRAETEGTITGAVFMGQGEPFHNYDTVIRAAKILSSPFGCRICAENITISTVGLVPQIQRFTEEGHLFRLIVSLTSAIQEKRAQMLPMAAKWTLQDLVAAIKHHADVTRGRVTVAWVMIKGFNTGRDEVDAMKDLFGDAARIKFNIIDVNDAREDGYKRASDEERHEFYKLLQELHVPIVRRYSVGNESHSACGMLANRLKESA